MTFTYRLRRPPIVQPWLLLAALCAGAVSFSAHAAVANLTVNAAANVNTFTPLNAFGVNIMFWNGRANAYAIQPKMLAAGNQFIRYPGGSSSDDYHWNGTGAFDSKSRWVPDDTAYSPSFVASETWRGTTSSYGVASHLTDGDTTTAWVSNAETDAPNAQWAYVDLGGSKTANSLQINWGDPYATQFKVQYWTGAAGWPPPNQATTNKWADCSSGTVTYTGTTMTVAFSSVSSQWFRVLCLASSTSPAQYSIAEMKLFNGAVQQTVNSPSPTTQSQGTVSSTDEASAYLQGTDFDFETFMAWLQSFSAQAKPLITINFGTGTPQEAAAWVHYANVVRGYGIKDWEIGNETEGNWETGGPLSAKDYARRYILFYQAMKAADPSIRIYGPVSGGPYEGSNDVDGKTYIKGFIDRLAADPGGNKAAYAEGIDFHWYPLYADSVEADQFGTIPKMATFAQTDLPAMLANHPSPSTVPVLMTEFNGGINCPVTTHLSNGIWLADWLGQFVTWFGSRGSTHMWDILEGGDADSSLTGSSLGLLNGNNGAYLYQERAHYWAMQLLAQRWAIPGDPAVHQLVQASTDQPQLTVYADKRPDGILALMVINKDPSTTYNTTLTLNGVSPSASAARWTLDASNYAWNTSAVPYHASPDSPPTAGTELGVANTFSHSFGPYSITVLQIQDYNLPQLSATPTRTPPPTPTATPTYGPTLMIDDFEDPLRNGAPPNRTNLMGGTWSTNQIAGGSATATYLSGGAATTAHGASWHPVVPAGGWANFPTSLPLIDAAGDGFVGVQFWAYGDGNSYRLMINTNAVTDYDNYGTNFTPPAGVWTHYQMPFAAMRRQGWGGQAPAPPVVPAANDIVGLQFAIASGTNDTLGLDQIQFYQAPAAFTPTATRSFTPTRTPTITPTPSATFTLSPTLTPSFSASPTASITPTFSDSPTPSVTFSISPSFSSTASFTDSPTPSLTATPSQVPTQTLTPTPSLTATPVATLSPSSTAAAWGPDATEITQVVAYPDPLTQAGPAVLKVLLQGKAASFRVRIYSSAYRRMADLTLPGGDVGWNSLLIPNEDLPANGIYFVEVWFEAGPYKSPLKRTTLSVVR